MFLLQQKILVLRQARKQEFFRAGEVSETYERKAPQVEISEIFFLDTLKQHFKREIKPIDEPSQGIFFPKSGHFSLNFEKGQGDLPPPAPASYAPVRANLSKQSQC